MFFILATATYIEHAYKGFLSRKKSLGHMIFTLVNNYILLNIGRFKITSPESNKRQFDYAIEICFLCIYVSMEVVERNNESYSSRLFGVKNFRKVQNNRPKVADDFKKLLKSSLGNFTISLAILFIFYTISKNFKISFLHLSMPVF